MCILFWRDQKRALSLVFHYAFDYFCHFFCNTAVDFLVGSNTIAFVHKCSTVFEYIQKGVGHLCVYYVYLLYRSWQQESFFQLFLAETAGRLCNTDHNASFCLRHS